jgi:DNA polymerase III subunit epsilon
MDILEVIKSGNFVVLDTETTGINSTSEIVSIAVIGSDGRVLLDTLVHPTRPIPKEATAIHGITNDMVKGALPCPAEFLHEMLKGKHVIIYNVGYDVTMLYRSTDMAGMAYIDWNKVASYYCAMEAFAEIYGDWNEYRQSYRWQKLTTAAAHYGISTEGAHGALADTLMTLKVCKAMADKQPIESAKL